MTFNQLETTFIGQFGKPHNREILEGYANRKDKSGKELSNYYKDIFNMLVNTPAWGVSGVNKMFNELTAAVRATLNNAKSGKTSAYAHANKMLNYIKHFGTKTAEARYNGRYKLAPILTEEELELLASIN